MVAAMKAQTAGAERLSTRVTFFGMQITHVQAAIATLSHTASTAVVAPIVAGPRHEYVACHKLSHTRKLRPHIIFRVTVSCSGRFVTAEHNI